MAHDTELDRILASLAKPQLAAFSDTLLDLRQWAFIPLRAGSCVKAYFELLEAAPKGKEFTGALAELRSWLESHLSIHVLDASRSEFLESLPLALDNETNLEEFCHRSMQRLRDDRSHTASRLRLEFALRQTA